MERLTIVASLTARKARMLASPGLMARARSASGKDACAGPEPASQADGGAIS
jgi:hypothetical protein